MCCRLAGAASIPRLKKHYELPIEIKTVCEIAADALVIEAKEK